MRSGLLPGARLLRATDIKNIYLIFLPGLQQRVASQLRPCRKIGQRSRIAHQDLDHFTNLNSSHRAFCAYNRERTA